MTVTSYGTLVVQNSEGKNIKSVLLWGKKADPVKASAQHQRGHAAVDVL